MKQQQAVNTQRITQIIQTIALFSKLMTVFTSFLQFGQYNLQEVLGTAPPGIPE